MDALHSVSPVVHGRASGWFLCGAVRNNAILNPDAQVFVGMYVFSSLSCMPGVDLWSCGSSVLTFWEQLHCFPLQMHLYNHQQCAGFSTPLSTLVIMCLTLAILVGVKRYDLHVPNDMLSTVSCAYWPLYVFMGDRSQILCPLLNWVLCLLIELFVLYVLWMSEFFSYIICKYVLLSEFFSYSWLCPLTPASSPMCRSPLCLFIRSLCFAVLLRDHCLFRGHKDLLLRVL